MEAILYWKVKNHLWYLETDLAHFRLEAQLMAGDIYLILNITIIDTYLCMDNRPAPHSSQWNRLVALVSTSNAIQVPTRHYFTIIFSTGCRFDDTANILPCFRQVSSKRNTFAGFIKQSDYKNQIKQSHPPVRSFEAESAHRITIAGL